MLYLLLIAGCGIIMLGKLNYFRLVFNIKLRNELDGKGHIALIHQHQVFLLKV